MLVELDLWKIKSTTPSIEEYLSVACVTIGVPCFVLTSLYLLGPKLSKDVIESSEVSALCNCTAAVARLINDIHSYKVILFSSLEEYFIKCWLLIFDNLFSIYWTEIKFYIKYSFFETLTSSNQILFQKLLKFTFESEKWHKNKALSG